MINLDIDINSKTTEILEKISANIKKVIHPVFIVEYIGTSIVEVYCVRFGSYSNIKVKYYLWPDGKEKFVWQINDKDLGYDRIVNDDIKNIVRDNVSKYLDSLAAMV